MDRTQCCRHPLAVATIIVLAVPLCSPSAAAAEAELFMDVATHDMPGMPGGAVSRGLMNVFGGAQTPGYGMAQFPAMPGRYLDIALNNRARPGGDAEQAIPAGLALGPSLPLRPAPVAASAANAGRNDGGVGDGAGDATTRILMYWGCGAEVRPGQPREINITVRNGQAKIDGTMEERYVASHGISAAPTVATWPNPDHGKQVPDQASLIGAHRVSGAGVPESLRFELQQAHDFMPKLQVSGGGSLAEGMTWSWQPVDRANGYFLAAVGTRDGATVMWNSAEVPGAGMGLIGYLDDAQVARWVREKVVLGPEVESCAMPREAFAGGAGMLSMVAYGPERRLAEAARNPEWTVRVRTKSTAMVTLGMDGATGPAVSPQETGKEALKRSAKGLLRGLLGR